MSDDEKNFSPVPVSRIIPDTELPVDVYLLIDKKYIKFKKAGDFIPGKKIDMFIEQKISSCFVQDDDFTKMIDWYNKIKDGEKKDLIDSIGKDKEDLVNRSEEIKEKTYQTYTEDELGPTTVKHLQNQVSELIKGIGDNPVITALLAKLNGHSGGIIEHSMNTANIAVFMGMTIGYNQQYMLENIFLGSVFHDFSLSKSRDDMTPNQYEVYYRNHPIDGAKALKAIKVVSKPVIDIVHQHHEQYDGCGYPQKLKGEDIFEPAQIVSMASQFDNALIENGVHNKNRFSKAIKSLEINSGRLFAPDLVSPVVKALRIVLENKEKEVDQKKAS